LLITPHFKMGGGQRVAINLLNNLNKNNFNIDVFVINNNGKLIDQISNKNINIIVSKYNKASKSLYQIKKIIDKNSYDLIFTFKSYLGIVTWLARFLSKKKPSIIYREVVHKSSNSSSQTFTSFIRKKLYIYLNKIMYNNVDKIIAPSEGIKYDLIENYSIKII
ncbi:MAG: glycosyltransferase, partial [archaeon]